jgi:cytochrome oxidase Cu insertion factor (SCO1/SenC/PrrC family)
MKTPGGQRNLTIGQITGAIVFVLLAISLGLKNHRFVIQGQTQPKSVSQARRFACPMHPEVTSNKPGICPKCRMRLRLVEPADDSTGSAGTTAADASGDSQPLISSAQIPDARVYDQDGKPHNFYTDLVKGKTVAINFVFTTCTGVCPPITATLRRVQQELPARAPAIQLISVSVDPETDTPSRLHEFAAKFHAGPGWTFVTGDRTEIDRILRALGVAVANKNDHTPMILIGNERTHYWTRVYGLSSPTTLVEAIRKAADTAH